jgi:glycosyltransferase involved in cell wall biosynthesis
VASSAADAWPDDGAAALEEDLFVRLATDVPADERATRALAPVVGIRSEQPRVSIVIPALNEAENLPYVLPRIPTTVHEVILVDGHSTDATTELALRLLPEIRIVSQQGRGKGAALRSGFATCTGDIIVMLDADGSTDPGEIPLFVAALQAGADFVKGSRFVCGGGTADMPFHRKLGNGGFVALTRLFFGARYSDLCYGYNAFWYDAVDLLALDATGFEIETMMNIRAHRVGLRVAEVPSFEHRRHHGEGRLRTFADGWRVLKTIFAECFRKRPQAARAPERGLGPLPDRV